MERVLTIIRWALGRVLASPFPIILVFNVNLFITKPLH